MKNKIAFGLCATGLGIASIGTMGLAIAGAGIILNKLKERETLRKYTL